ncbi:hypothetical protein KIPB_009401 [Kipferlia bialata]|uniref:Uncharacterized protein n=1 Tax=Kipferlia bialata TaxID=797122 RepID=A0A9K3GM32_9EUKA|nr:hypothetical protein KIPB_009401 [Kipferlia bialata]|eukprot:g9401.t1
MRSPSSPDNIAPPSREDEWDVAIAETVAGIERLHEAALRNGEAIKRKREALHNLEQTVIGQGVAIARWSNGVCKGGVPLSVPPNKDGVFPTNFPTTRAKLVSLTKAELRRLSRHYSIKVPAGAKKAKLLAMVQDYIGVHR